jgi:hypothetical protein
MGVVAAPLAIAMPYIRGAVTVASVGVQYMTAQKDAKNAKEAQDKYNENVRETTRDQLKDATSAKADLLENSGKDSLQASLDFMEAKSSTEANANAVGARGGSFDMLLNDMKSESAQVKSDVNANRTQGFRQMQKQSDAIRQGGARNLDNRVIKRPSMAGAIMQGASSGMQAGYQGYKIGGALKTAYSDSRIGGTT